MNKYGRNTELVMHTSFIALKNKVIGAVTLTLNLMRVIIMAWYPTKSKRHLSRRQITQHAK
jgi:hypothetical protein